MPTELDYYEILNVQRDADGDTIKRSYRKMAMKYHPDRNPGDEEAERQFKAAAEAYEVLSDDQKRARYDQYGHAGLRGAAGHDFGSMDATDIFSMFEDIFGGRGGGGRQRARGGGPRRGYSLETAIEISLEEVLSGCEHEVKFTRQDLCGTCEGSGAEPGSKPKPCVTCGGAGKVQQGGGFFRMVSTCPACQGRGEVVGSPCKTCRGEGRQPKERQLNVTVPAGIPDGATLRISGEGEPGNQGGPPGDLHVVVHIAEHEMFQRHNEHLMLELPISFTQAALGATTKVPTLEGETELIIAAGTQHGERFVINGQGLPRLRRGGVGPRGDLYVVVQVEIPNRLTERQEELLREFAETEDHDVMPRAKGFWDKMRTYVAGLTN